MGIHNSAESPYSSEDLMVSKMLGPAYRNVRLVAENMTALQLLADGAEVLIGAAATVDSAVAAMDADRTAVDAAKASVDASVIAVEADKTEAAAAAVDAAAAIVTAQTAATNAEASAAAAAASALEATNISGSNFLPLTGGTVTGNVLIEGELVTDPLPYSAAWAGSDRVANQNDVYTKIASMESLYGALNGLATLSGGKIPLAQIPDSVVGAMKFQTVWNASTNTPAIPAAAAGNNGHYYIVSVAGATDIGGNTDWEVGDWVVSDGTAWRKLDNTDKVSSVAGLTGVITQAALKAALGLVKGDVGLGNVDNTSDANKPVSTAQAAVHASLQTNIDAKADKLVGTTVASNGSITPTFSSDFTDVTALAAAATIEAPTGTPVNMHGHVLRIKDNGVARTLTWNAAYRAIGVTLPATTVVGKTLIVGMVYNTTAAKFDVVSVRQEA